MSCRAVILRKGRKMSLHTFRIAMLLLCLFTGFESQAQAYTDPGTGALIWQVVVAGFVGALFYIRRITAFFSGFRKKQSDPQE
jgi:hypothetical protein